MQDGNKRIAESAFAVMMLTIVVKGIGFVKQMVIASQFGTSMQMDLFLVVSEFVGEIGVVFFSSLSINLVTLYTHTKEEGREAVNTLISNTIVVFMVLSVFVSAILCLGANYFAIILAPGLEDTGLMAMYIRCFSFILASICIGNICTAVLNAESRFLPGKSVGMIQSACVIAACVFLKEYMGIWALFVGTFAYYVLQSVFLLKCISRRVSFRPRASFRDSMVRRLIRLCVPLFLSNAVIQLNAMANKAIASSLEEGSISALSYGGYIFSTIHSIIIGNLCTVLFTSFVSDVDRGDFQSVFRNFRKSTLLLLFFLAPIAMVCVNESELIVRVLFGRGNFDDVSVYMTKSAVAGYSFGILLIAVRDLMIQLLYAYQKTRTAMINGVVGVAANILLSLTLSKYIKIFGIALADSIAYAIVMAMGYTALKKYGINPIDRNLRVETFKIMTAMIGCFIADFILKEMLKTGNYYLNCVARISLALACYFLISVMLKSQALATVRGLVFRAAGKDETDEENERK